MLDVTILHRTVSGDKHQEAEACFRPENETCSEFDVSSLRASKPCTGCGERYSLIICTRSNGRMYCLSLNPSCLGTCFKTKVRLFEETDASVESNYRCRECDGTGWVFYHSETVDGTFEEAYRLCPQGHAPRYCMGSSSGHHCSRPATVRCGQGYYCKEHIAFIHDGRDVDDPCEAP